MSSTSPPARNPLRRAVPVVLVAAWCGLIYWFSDQPDLTISDDDALDFLLRKAAHVVVFAVLCALLWWAARETVGMAMLRSQLATALFGTLLYASLDEWHQTFVEGRVGHVQDVGIDMVGAGVAAVAVWLICRRSTPEGTPHDHI